jgi:hypothetical protein
MNLRGNMIFPIKINTIIPGGSIPNSVIKQKSVNKILFHFES